MMGDHGRRAVIDEQPRGECFEPETFSSPGLVWVEAAPPPGPVAAWKSTECSIELPSAFSGAPRPCRRRGRAASARHLAVEGPVAERACLRRAAPRARP
jgi:hypothetical protein